eukprot:COSAG01_NODE_20_length_38868_cov_34.606071_6_plen_46_part_00
MLGLRVLLLQGSGLCALLLLIGGEKLPLPAAIIHALHSGITYLLS